VKKSLTPDPPIDKAKEEIKKKKYRKHFQISSTFTEKSKNLFTPKS
jgi:hypothetical protein